MKCVKAQFRKGLLTPLYLLGAGIIFSFLFDLSINAYWQLLTVYICVNVIMGLSLNLINGFTGQFSLGHAGFMAVGAYCSAFLSTKLTFFSGPLHMLNFPIYAISGGLLAAFAGWVVGLPSLRLKGDYLAIVTLGFSEIIRVLLLNIEAVGGARGLYGIMGFQPLTLDFGESELILSSYFFSFLHAFLWAGMTFLIIWRLVRSTHGRCFLSVRDDEVAAESMGVNTTQTKVRAFVLSSFFAGVAGSLFAHFANYLNPSTFSFLKSVDALIIVVLGGMGSLSGSVIAAIFITIMPEALRPLQELTGIDLRLVIYALALILLMLLRPTGLMGSKELPQLWRRDGKPT